jgi:phenylacetate-CoA ligase
LLDEPPPRVTPPLKLKIECGEGIKEEDLPGLEKEISEALKGKLNFTPKIIWVPPHTIERSTYKTKFIEKLYDKKTS